MKPDFSWLGKTGLPNLAFHLFIILTKHGLQCVKRKPAEPLYIYIYVIIYILELPSLHLFLPPQAFVTQITKPCNSEHFERKFLPRAFFYQSGHFSVYFNHINFGILTSHDDLQKPDQSRLDLSHFGCKPLCGWTC